MRSTDSYRKTPMWEGLVNRAVREGKLPKKPTTEQAEAHFEVLRAHGKLEGEVTELIGDDLSPEMLDDLWEVLGGGGNYDTYTGQWWDDKPHQIAYRLLLRLTRAEAKLAELSNSK